MKIGLGISSNIFLPKQMTFTGVMLGFAYNNQISKVLFTNIMDSVTNSNKLVEQLMNSVKNIFDITETLV